jgi:hypothetical protein
MKPCTGCKHLHIGRGGIVYCQEHWDGYERVVDPYTNTTRLVSRSKYQQGVAWPMRVEEMRKPGGPCGPEATLFAPSAMWRLLGRLERWLGCGENA